MDSDFLVVLTRESSDNERLAKMCSDAGLRVLDYPCVAARALPCPPDAVIDGTPLREFKAVAFASKRGADGMKAAAGVLRESRPFIGSVGEATSARIKEILGLEADLTAEPSVGEALAKAMMKALPKDARVLYVRGNKTEGGFARIMQEAGRRLSEIIVYEIYAPELKPIADAAPKIVVVASPSAAAGYFNANAAAALDRFAAIGSTTAGALKKMGAEFIVEAEKPDDDCLFEAIKKAIK